jgi:hypothetical protein
MIITLIFSDPDQLNYLNARMWVYTIKPWLDEHVGACTITKSIDIKCLHAEDTVPNWDHFEHILSSVVNHEVPKLYSEWFYGKGWQIFIVEDDYIKTFRRRITVYVQIDEPTDAVHFKLACL